MTRIAILAILALSLCPQAATAQTAAELEALPQRERIAFMRGAIGMAITDSNKERAHCIREWFFNGTTAGEQSGKAFATYPDENAVLILSVLIDDACGKL